MAAKTDLSNYLSYGVDEKHRRIFFGSCLDHADEDSGSFHQTSVSYAIRAIHRMASDKPKTPIEIHMNSYGGDPYAMLELYDVLQTCTCQIIFYGGGAIMSAATWIMAGSDVRYLYPNATVMVHAGNEWMEGNHTDLQITSEENKRLQILLEDIYAKNSRMPKSFWSEVCKRDLYLSAEETVLLGLADKVVAPVKRGNLRKSRQHHLSQKVNHNKMKKLMKKLTERIHLKPESFSLNEPIQEPTDDNIVVDPQADLEIPNEE